MPWQEFTVMDARRDFVALARQEGTNIRELCRRFGISPKTGYKLLHRFAAEGVAGLADRSRRPHRSPRQTPDAMVAHVLAMREAHPTWGGRKIHHALIRRGLADRTATTRFARAAPNELWQLAFMGHRPLRTGRVHPLTLIDDHSRFLLALVAATTEDLATVQPAVFQRDGLPWEVLCDHGPPWGHVTKGRRDWTRLEVWLLRLGITITHGRIRHPQTQGKIERLHGTIAADVFGTRVLADVAAAQTAFDAFRTAYNHERPHQALADAVPAERYRASDRAYPERLPDLVYAADAQIRKVAPNGTISVQGRRVGVGKAFGELSVGLVPTPIDGQYRVQFAHQVIGTIDLRTMDTEASECYPCP